MHAASDNRRLQTWSEESDEAHLICSVPLEILLRYGHLRLFSIRTSLDDAAWRKWSASFALGASSISIKLDMSTTYQSVVVRKPPQYYSDRRTVKYQLWYSSGAMIMFAMLCFSSKYALADRAYSEGMKQDVGIVSYVVHYAPECVNHHVDPHYKKYDVCYTLEVLNPQFDQIRGACLSQSIATIRRTLVHFFRLSSTPVIMLPWQCPPW